MSQILTDIQKVKLTVQPISAAGNPAPVDGVPEWSVSAPNILTLTVSDDGMSAEAITTGVLGVCQVNVKADADLGAGVVTIAGTLDVEVIASQAASVGLAAGVPESRV